MLIRRSEETYKSIFQITGLPKLISSSSNDDIYRLQSARRSILSSLQAGKSLVVHINLQPEDAQIFFEYTGTSDEQNSKIINSSFQKLIKYRKIKEIYPKLSGKEVFYLSPKGDNHRFSIGDWPNEKIDIGGILESCYELRSKVSVHFSFTRLDERINKQVLERRAQRTVNTDKKIDYFRQSLSKGSPLFLITVEINAENIEDAQSVARHCYPNSTVFLKDQKLCGDKNLVNKLFDGEAVFLEDAVDILPISEVSDFSRIPLQKFIISATSSINDKSPDIKIGLNHDGIADGFLIEDLSKHIVLYGKSGYGKSTTAATILHRIWEDFSIPFLVVDPIKEDYPELLASIQPNVIKLGSSESKPFNIFAPPPGIDPFDYCRNITTIIGQVSNLDSYPLGMQKFQYIMHECYAKWIASGRQGWLTFNYILKGIEYEISKSNIKSDAEVYSSITTRISNFMRGTPGMAINGGPTDSIDWEELLSKPTILLGNSISDPATVNMILSIIFIGLMLYRKNNPAADKHLLVLEEAHRIFNTNPQAHDLVEESVSTGLAVLRDRNQGIFLITQIPLQLPESVRYLTASVLTHRIDWSSAASLAPDNERTIQLITGLDKGEVIYWSAAGDPSCRQLKVTKHPKLIKHEVNSPFNEIIDAFANALQLNLQPFNQFSNQLDTMFAAFLETQRKESQGLELAHRQRFIAKEVFLKLYSERLKDIK